MTSLTLKKRVYIPDEGVFFYFYTAYTGVYSRSKCITTFKVSPLADLPLPQTLQINFISKIFWLGSISIGLFHNIFSVCLLKKNYTINLNYPVWFVLGIFYEARMFTC